jgi:hypothetical protein
MAIENSEEPKRKDAGGDIPSDCLGRMFEMKRWLSKFKGG